MDYKTILKQSSDLLKSFSIKSARLDSELLLSSSLKISRENLLLNLDMGQDIFRYFVLVMFW